MKTKNNKTNKPNYKNMVLIAITLLVIIYIVIQTNAQTPKPNSQTNTDYLAKGNLPQNNPQIIDPNDLPQIPANVPRLNVLTIDLLDSLRVKCTKTQPENDVIIYRCNGKIYFAVDSPRNNPLGMTGTLQLIDTQTGQMRQIPLPIRGVKEGVNQFTVSSPSIGFEQWNVQVCDAQECKTANQNNEIITTIT